MLYSLVLRNNKIFLRNKGLVFFSLLSVLIVVGLYVVFLQKIQLDSIEALIPVTQEIEDMVNRWMISGVLSITAVTTTLGAFSIYVKDLETRANADFLSTQLSRAAIQFSYCISSFFIGFILTIVAFAFCLIYLIVTGGEFLSGIEILQVVGLIFISVLLSSVLASFIAFFINSQSAFSTVNSIIGTVIGFLCGVYVPMGVLPSFVQTIIHYFPVSHTTVLFRNVLMADTIEQVFPTHEAKEEYMLTYGVQYEIGGTIIEPWVSLVFIIGAIMIIGGIVAILFIRKNK